MIQVGSDQEIKALHLEPLASKIEIPFEKIDEKYFLGKFLNFEENEECKRWGNIHTYKEELFLGTGTIIHGKKVGRTIGIPTANIDFGEEKIVEHNLIPGVYFGRCMFVGPEKVRGIEEMMFKNLPMVMSIGYNLQYNQTNINYEVLILHDFGKIEFYDTKLKVILQGFIRAEAKF